MRDNICLNFNCILVYPQKLCPRRTVRRTLLVLVVLLSRRESDSDQGQQLKGWPDLDFLYFIKNGGSAVKIKRMFSGVDGGRIRVGSNGRERRESGVTRWYRGDRGYPPGVKRISSDLKLGLLCIPRRIGTSRIRSDPNVGTRVKRTGRRRSTTGHLDVGSKYGLCFTLCRCYSLRERLCQFSIIKVITVGFWWL